MLPKNLGEENQNLPSTVHEASKQDNNEVLIDDMPRKSMGNGMLNHLSQQLRFVLIHSHFSILYQPYSDRFTIIRSRSCIFRSSNINGLVLNDKEQYHYHRTRYAARLR